MVQLNEAWAILRDPESRRAYDQYLDQQGVTSTAITTAVASARNSADQYPRQWSEFERWMNAILNDFTQAEYGWAKSGIYQAPTAKNSVSGTILIIIGGVIGFFFGLALYLPFKDTLYEKAAMLVPIFGIAAGGSVGALIHALIGAGISSVRQTAPRSTPPPRPSTSTPPPITSEPPPLPKQTRTIRTTCPHCGQHIEAPAECIGTIVSCPTCNGQFHIGKRPPAPTETPQPPPIPSQTQRQPPPIPDQHPRQPPPIP
jgi:curved DNA-binding protein CbpA